MSLCPKIKKYHLYTSTTYWDGHETKNYCSDADLAIGIIEQKAISGNIKPNLWWRYRDDIFDLWTMGHAKLLKFTQFINSLYSTFKFTLVHSPTSLDVLDYNPSLPSIGKILYSHRHLIDNSPSILKIFPRGSIIPSFRRARHKRNSYTTSPHRS